MHRLALIGGRGFTGTEFLKLLAGHGDIELVLATSDSRAGQLITEIVPEWPDPDQAFESLRPDAVAGVKAGVWVLAMPNDQAAPWVAAIEIAHPDAVILDLGADYRLDAEWVFGLTEFNREVLAGARRIANPGGYATGALFGLLPIRTMLVSPPVIFGISGFSGAGRRSSPRNDPGRLRANLIPYGLTGHMNESEISVHLGRPARLHPHVGPFFRGISLTIAVQLTEPVSTDLLLERYRECYEAEPLVRVDETIPEIRHVAETPGLAIGGFSVDQRDSMRVSFVVTLDNLLKGAASQALQNINLALGLDELAAIEHR